MENNQEPKIVKFEDIKNQILEEINKRGSTKHWIHESTTLINGFVNQPITMELSWNFTIGWPTIPMIMLLWNDSGRVYYFALKALLPTII